MTRSCRATDTQLPASIALQPAVAAIECQRLPLDRKARKRYLSFSPNISIRIVSPGKAGETNRTAIARNLSSCSGANRFKTRCPSPRAHFGNPCYVEPCAPAANHGVFRR